MAKPQQSKKPLGGWLGLLGWFCGLWIYTELALHLLIFGMPAKRILYPILFGAGAGALSTLLCQWLPLRGQRWAATGLTILPVLWALVQYVYQAAFGSMMPLSQLGLGGNILDFREQLFYTLGKHLPQLLLLLLPLLLWLLLLLLRRSPCRVLRGRWLPASLGALVLAVGLALGLMYATRAPAASVWRLFVSVNTNATASYRSVGVVGTVAQELRQMLFSRGDQVALTQPMNLEDPDPSLARNTLDLDFAALASGTEDAGLKQLDRFFGQAGASPKNQYTGLLKGFNVITVCAESFSPWLISPELTPTLYRLSQGGFVFENFYGCFQSVTTNGEYALCLGLLPDLSRTKTASSFDESVGHYLPFALGNALKELGYDTWAYHNYIGEFYNRNQTHSNMGYTFKSAGNGLDITMQWPASDLELIQASVEDYLHSGKPFHAYYMSFSGHYQYNWHNAMSLKNRERTRDLPYSETVKAYIACNLELEDAMGCLVEKLEQAGILDRTLIVLTGDHYPYGLSAEEYNELAGRPIDTSFEKYHNSFLCYTSALEPVVVRDYCCTVDILPTLLNLLGVPYDARLLAGRDVLAPGPHAAVLETHSFLTQDFRYDAENGSLIPNQPGEEISPQELENWKLLVEQKFDLSREILNRDYYSHVFGRSGPDISLDTTAQYQDLDSIFAQASATWLVDKDYMDPDSPEVFGGARYVSLGEFVDCLYRVAGRPSASPAALPGDYLARYGDPARLEGLSRQETEPAAFCFDPDCFCYEAICWAFETGLLQPTDHRLAPDESIRYLDVALLVTRFCRAQGVEIQVRSRVDETGEEYDALERMAPLFPDYSREELAAAIWCDQEHIISLAADLEEYLHSATASVKRASVISYLFRVCSYELGMK